MEGAGKQKLDMISLAVQILPFLRVSVPRLGLETRGILLPEIGWGSTGGTGSANSIGLNPIVDRRLSCVQHSNSASPCRTRWRMW